VTEIQIRPVRTRRERRAFLTLPWRIYHNDPLWVPPLLSERAKTIDPERGSFFQHGEAECFVAWREGRAVGTVCAAEDSELNALLQQRECTFGFFECIDDDAVAEAMLNTVQAWAAARALDTITGPFNLDRENAYGVLIEGRDRPPVLLCGHTPPYYQDLLERIGFGPARGDNLAYAVELHDTPTLQRLSRLADRVRQRGRIVIREPDMAHWEDEVDRVYHLLLKALAHLPDFVPWRRSEVHDLLAPFVDAADPELILFAEADGQTVGWFPGIANWNESLHHANGLRYPWNYLRLWWHLRRSRPACLAVKSVLVLPEYWDTGVSVLLFDEMAKRARAKGYRWIDLSLTSEDNPYTPALATRLGARLYKRYRVYRLEIEQKHAPREV
jgi:GNAT superfamily N-acetyltransferase